MASARNSIWVAITGLSGSSGRGCAWGRDRKIAAVTSPASSTSAATRIRPNRNMDVWCMMDAPTGSNLLCLLSPYNGQPPISSESPPAWRCTQQIPCPTPQNLAGLSCQICCHPTAPLLAARAAETAFASLAGFEVLHDIEFSLHHRHDDKLCQPL